MGSIPSYLISVCNHNHILKHIEHDVTIPFSGGRYGLQNVNSSVGQWPKAVQLRRCVLICGMFGRQIYNCIWIWVDRRRGIQQ